MALYISQSSIASEFKFKRMLVDLDGRAAPLLVKLMRLSILDEKTIREALKEFDEWCKHPHAFSMEPIILAAGKV